MLDNSNHEGIVIPHFKNTLLYLFGEIVDTFSDIEDNATDLYAIMHARYIQTDLGMHQMVVM